MLSRVFGLVNNFTFNEQGIMLKNVPQELNGNLYIFSRNFATEQIYPLSFENVYLRTINGNLMSDFFKNVAQKNNPITIDTPIVFEKKVTTNNFISSSLFKGVDIEEITSKLKLNSAKSMFTNKLQYLHQISSKIVAQLRSIEPLCLCVILFHISFRVFFLSRK